MQAKEYSHNGFIEEMEHIRETKQINAKDNMAARVVLVIIAYAKQSKAKQTKAKQSKAKHSKTKQSKYNTTIT